MGDVRAQQQQQEAKIQQIQAAIAEQKARIEETTKLSQMLGTYKSKSDIAKLLQETTGYKSQLLLKFLKTTALNNKPEERGILLQLGTSAFRDGVIERTYATRDEFGRSVTHDSESFLKACGDQLYQAHMKGNYNNAVAPFEEWCRAQIRTAEIAMEAQQRELATAQAEIARIQQTPAMKLEIRRTETIAVVVKEDLDEAIQFAIDSVNAISAKSSYYKNNTAPEMLGLLESLRSQVMTGSASADHTLALLKDKDLFREVDPNNPTRMKCFDALEARIVQCQQMREQVMDARTTNVLTTLVTEYNQANMCAGQLDISIKALEKYANTKVGSEKEIVVRELSGQLQAIQEVMRTPGVEIAMLDKMLKKLQEFKDSALLGIQLEQSHRWHGGLFSSTKRVDGLISASITAAANSINQLKQALGPQVQAQAHVERRPEHRRAP